MAQAGLHTYIALKLKNKFSSKKYYFSSFILGSALPDLDIIIVSLFSILFPLEKSIYLFHRTFTHSIFSCIIIFLIFLILYEITNSKNYLNIGRGITFGILLHILIDTFFWFDSIHLLWPLPMEHLNLWYNFRIPMWSKKVLLSLEFLFFRFFAWELTKIIILRPENNGKYLKKLNSYMKIQFLLLILFLISCLIINNDLIYYVFGIFYLPSLIMLIYYINILKINIDNYVKIDKNKIKNIYHSKTSIQNIE